MTNTIYISEKVHWLLYSMVYTAHVSLSFFLIHSISILFYSWKHLFIRWVSHTPLLSSDALLKFLSKSSWLHTSAAQPSNDAAASSASPPIDQHWPSSLTDKVTAGYLLPALRVFATLTVTGRIYSNLLEVYYDARTSQWILSQDRSKIMML